LPRRPDALPTVVHSQVDPAAITKVTRLFNNTLGSILTELIQNARRAGATTVDLDVEADDRQWLVIADDGAGIADPAVILALGRSGWDDDIAAREDPAGMGVFRPCRAPCRNSFASARRRRRLADLDRARRLGNGRSYPGLSLRSSLRHRDPSPTPG
jgi:hypothetical protein